MFLCIGPHAAFADDSPPGREVVITPGKAAPPSGAGKRTVVLAGPFPPAAPPAANKSSQQTTSKTSTPTASPPPAPPRRACASASASTCAGRDVTGGRRASRAKSRVVPRKRARSHASVHGGQSLRVALHPVARGGPSEAQTQPVDLAAPAGPPAVAASATPAAVAAPPARPTNGSDSLKWVVPVVALAGLLALLVAIRFAYWRWAIRRSRHHVANGIASKTGEHASKDAYPVYRGTRRWGR